MSADVTERTPETEILQAPSVSSVSVVRRFPVGHPGRRDAPGAGGPVGGWLVPGAGNPEDPAPGFCPTEPLNLARLRPGTSPQGTRRTPVDHERNRQPRSPRP